MTLVRVPGWGCEIARADYYGWRYCLRLGPWMLFFWKVGP